MTIWTLATKTMRPAATASQTQLPAGSSPQGRHLALLVPITAISLASHVRMAGECLQVCHSKLHSYPLLGRLPDCQCNTLMLPLESVHLLQREHVGVYVSVSQSSHPAQPILASTALLAAFHTAAGLLKSTGLAQPLSCENCQQSFQQ
jgi:hypothetical protein